MANLILQKIVPTDVFSPATINANMSVIEVGAQAKPAVAEVGSIAVFDADRNVLDSGETIAAIKALGYTKSEADNRFANIIIKEATGASVNIPDVLVGNNFVEVSSVGVTTQDGVPTPTVPIPLVIAKPAAIEVNDGQGNSISYPLPAEVTARGMNGIGAVADKFDLVSGLDTQNYYTVVADGTEAWLASTESKQYYIFTAPFDIKPDSSGRTLCSHFEYVSPASQTGQYRFGGGSIPTALTFNYDNTGTDLAGWKAWIAAQHAAGTPVTVAYQLATPIITQYTPQVVLQNVNAFPVAATGDATGNIAVKYSADTNKVIAQLMAAINALGGA